MAQRGEEIAGKRAKPSDDGGAAVEDSFSALPDDVIVVILLRVDTAAAVRTSALSRRWRRVWTLLPELCFHLRPDGPRIREILDAPEAPELRCLSVATEGVGPESAAAWLPAAARRLSGDLAYYNIAAPMNEDEEDAAERGSVQLPCFEKATTIALSIGFLGLALPSHGVFARITELSLRCVRSRCPPDLGDVVSSPRCPSLKKLEVHKFLGLHNLSIHSNSLLQMNLENLHRLQELRIEAPFLQELSLNQSLLYNDSSEVRANISAPRLVSLEWKDVYDQQYVNLGNLGQLQHLATYYFCVYGQHDIRVRNHHCLRLLQQFQFQALYHLNLSLVYLQMCNDQFFIGNMKQTCQDIDDFQYLMEDITMLPQITSLQLAVLYEGYAHAFGASSFHLLRMCTGLRLLLITLHALEGPSTCPSGCICDQPMSWKTEGLVLNNLASVAIFGLQGAEHEVTFVKQLFNWETALKMMRITFDYRITESKAREFRQAIAGSSRPETSVEIYMYRDVSKGSTYLLA